MRHQLSRDLKDRVELIQPTHSKRPIAIASHHRYINTRGLYTYDPTIDNIPPMDVKPVRD